MRIDFSKTAIQQLPPPESGRRLTVYDSKVSSLAIRVTHKGAKTFYVVKRAGASMAWLKLGTFPDMTVEQARHKAYEALAAFSSGANPAAAKRALRQEPTFAEVFETFLQEKRKRDGSALSEKTKRHYTDCLNLYLAPLAKSRISKISRDDVRAIHRKVVAKSPSQADRCVALISAVFSFALDREIVSGQNPASRIQKTPPPSRDRFARADELPYLVRAMSLSEQKDFFLLALLTGARRSNLQSMAWREIDFDAAVWRIGKTKNGTPQNVALSPEAVSLLQERRSMAADQSPFVFPGTGASGHLMEPKNAWATVLRRASMSKLLDLLQARDKLSIDARARFERRLEITPNKAEADLRALAQTSGLDPADFDMTDLRIHDLRRTLGSWQAKTGASLAIIGKSLNHKTHQATAIYARLDLDPVRQSVNTATAAMLEAAGVKPAAQVVPLSGRRGLA